MNYEQLMLLKLSEEVGEIADALLIPFVLNSTITGFDQFQTEHLNELLCELNDFFAVVHILNDSHKFEYFYPEIDMGLLSAIDGVNEFRSWVDKAVVSCLAVSKLASKTMQFGMNETQPQLKKNNRERLHDAINNLRFHVAVLNKFFNLNFTVNDELLCAKVEKIYEFAGYSQGLGQLMDYQLCGFVGDGSQTNSVKVF